MCGCKFELPYFVGYDRKSRAQGLTTEGFKVVKPFWSQHQLPYPTVIGNETFAKQRRLSGMPFTLLIDKHGDIAIAHAGVLDRQDFDHYIEQLIAER